MEFLRKTSWMTRAETQFCLYPQKPSLQNQVFCMKLLWEMEEAAKRMLLNQRELYQRLRNPWKTLFLSTAALVQGDLCHINFKTLLLVELNRERKHVNLGCRMKLSSPYPETSWTHLKLEFLGASQYQVRIIHWFWH